MYESSKNPSSPKGSVDPQVCSRYTFCDFIQEHFPKVSARAVDSYTEELKSSSVDLPSPRVLINDYLFQLAAANPRVFGMLMDSYNLYLYTEVNGNTVL